MLAVQEGWEMQISLPLSCISWLRTSLLFAVNWSWELNGADIAIVELDFVTSHFSAWCSEMVFGSEGYRYCPTRASILLPRMSVLSVWDARKNWKVQISALLSWILSPRASVRFALRWSWELEGRDITLLALYFVTSCICAFCLRCPWEQDDADITTIEAVFCYLTVVCFFLCDWDAD